MATQRSKGFARLAVCTTGLTLALVALGGAVRATDSGMACPDWPRCFGLWVPPADLHIWLEHSHRLLAGVVGILILLLTIWAVARFRHRRSLLWASVAALLLVNLQAALGALVVWNLLEAGLVTAHLGMAMAVVACLIYLAVDASRPPSPVAQPGSRDRRFAWAASAVAALCFSQILVGGHVTGIGAGLVYTDFPLMGGAVLPSVATVAEGFHVAHRLLAYLLAGSVVLLCAAAVSHRRDLQAAGAWTDAHRWIVTLPLWVSVLVVLQIGLGVANLANRASFLTVIPHLAVASWMWATLVLLTILAHRLAPPKREAATQVVPVREGASA